jgi:hypothetical protein
VRTSHLAPRTSHLPLSTQRLQQGARHKAATEAGWNCLMSNFKTWTRRQILKREGGSCLSVHGSHWHQEFW